jgi:hypothetical protein
MSNNDGYRNGSVGVGMLNDSNGTKKLIMLVNESHFMKQHQ